MMGYRQLCLLLLLGSCALAQDVSDNNEQTSTCQMASRFKPHKKYVYQYTTENRNGVQNSANQGNGHKLSCQVEVEVPQMCRFIMYTRDCALSEAGDVNPLGKPVYEPAPESEAFRAVMEKNPLKFTVEEATNVKLYPEADDPVNILNIKRGIISAFMVPVKERDDVYPMSTVHGLCPTDYLMNSNEGSVTDVSLSRDLSQCDHFYGRELTNSPLALLQKLNYVTSKLITSTQDCNYQFDHKGKHITTSICREQHTYQSLQGNTGMSSLVIQELALQSNRRINNRAFDVNNNQNRPLHLDDPDTKSGLQTKETILSTLQDLMALPGTDQGHERTSIFHKLVSGLRVLTNETLSQTLPEMMDVSGWVTWQALFQCGTAECTSAILQAIRTIDGVSLEVDALVYALSLQADPGHAQVRDMLSMAQYKQSKAILYALSNTVRKFHKGEVTPVVTDVSKFMELLLNDCSGETVDDGSDSPPDPDERSYLALRVIGAMGSAMQDVSPSLIAALLQCAQKTDIPLANQKAAVQAFRLMDIKDEMRNVLMEVYRNAESNVEKRIAAYLTLMKKPDQALVTEIVNGLKNIKDKQVKNFVVSHLSKMFSTAQPHMHPLRQFLDRSAKDPLYHLYKIFEGMSENYRLGSPLGSVKSNIIFDDVNTLPKEMMLETTVKVFDYEYDIFEVGIEGTGFEPTIEALFGEKGFFPDSISKVIYWAGENSQTLKKILDRLGPNRDRMRRQVPQDLLKDITSTVQKLMRDVTLSPAPEVTAYLRLLGNEIGYVKTNEMRKIFEALYMYYHFFFRVLPAKAFFELTSSTENEVFAHYILMENAFSLPTASGLPLKFSLAGVVTAGAKGGLSLSPSKTALSFMPSVGIEIITQMGVHAPNYVEAGLEMHTNMYHESSLNAMVTVDKNQMKFSIPAPKSNTQLFSFRNKLLSTSSSQTKPPPPPVGVINEFTECQPLFSGLRLCTTVHNLNPDNADNDQGPYNPLTENRFMVEVQPTGEVSEYTASITDETLREGKKGRHRVQTVKITLKAEGEDPTEATLTLKHNRNRNTFTADFVSPDYNVDVGVKLAVTDSDARGKKTQAVTIDVTSGNLPQLTLVGRASGLDRMTDQMLQLQMVIPPLKTDSSLTATLKMDEDLVMDLETLITLPETSFQQKLSLKYNDDKVELELKSDLNSDIRQLIPDLEEYQRQLQMLIDQMLDNQVTMTDMKLRHIVTKGIEAANIWLDKLSARMPYLPKLKVKRSISDLTLPALPEKLYLQCDHFFQYQFNKEKMALSFRLPFGGKTSEELNVPATLPLPRLDLPELGLHVPANNIRLPSFTIPPSLDFTVPLLGLAELSTKINSNLFSWEGSISGGNSTVDVPNYIVQYKNVAQSPFSLLSYKIEGTGMMSGRADDNLKYLLNSSFSHNLIDASFSILEMLSVTNKLKARANYKIEASSPVGLHASLYYSAQSTSTLDSEEVSGDGTVDGLLKIGSFNTNATYTQSYNLRPLDREGRGESTLRFNTPFIQLNNVIQGVYANSELNIVSKTTGNKDIIKHVAELKYKDAQLTLKCNALATPMDMSLSNKVELGISSQMALFRMESQAEDGTNRAYTLLTGSLDSNGLEVNSEGSLIVESAMRGLHKASLMVGKTGLTTSGTNSIQCSPVTLEHVFSGGIDMNGATASSQMKAAAEESRAELDFNCVATATEASLSGILNGHAYDASTKNNVNIELNRRALTFTANNMGSLKQMSTENSHTLTVTLWTLDLHSKTNNFICEDVYYKQETKANVKPFIVSADMTNDLKFYDARLDSESHVKLEPVKVDFSGSVKGTYKDNYLKNTGEFNYDNMAGTMRHGVSGNMLGAQLSHNCDVEFAGFSSKTNCETSVNSEPLRFDSTVRTMALPFSLTVDALVNSDGKLNLNGKHTGQLFGKLLVKAEPLALAYSHNSRVSTTHKLLGEKSSANLDNKFEGLLTPSEQSLTWKVKSKLNNHGYDQDIRTYNNPEKIGFEFSGVMRTDIMSPNTRPKRDVQDFSVTSMLVYNKNTECHIIDIPFIESFPAAFEQLKNFLVQALESFQQSINNFDIYQLIEDFRAKLDRLPMQVSDMIKMMDLEGKVNRVKVKLDYLIHEFSITMDDLEITMNNLRQNLESTVIDIATRLRDFILTIKDHVKAKNISNLLSQIGSQLSDFDRMYEIKQSLIKGLVAIEDIIRQIDLHKLTESTAAWLQELDSKYFILEKIKDMLVKIKEAIEGFDINTFFQDTNDYLISIDLPKYVEQLSYQIPSSEIAKVIESMNDVIVNWIDEYEIPSKLNSVYFYIRDLLTKYDLDNKFKELMDEVLILINELKIDETVKATVDALKSIKFEVVLDKIMQSLHSIISQLRDIDFKESIDYLNDQMLSIYRSMKELNYNAFIEDTNRNIVELTNHINKQIETFEIVQKIEAVREFFREIQNSVYTYLDELKKTTVADALKKLENVINTTFYNDIKTKAKDILDDVRQRILDMDIRDEMSIYLQRASESYSNIVAFISVQFNDIIEKIRKVAGDIEIISRVKQFMDRGLNALKKAEIKIPSFTVPLTDLVIPAFSVNLNKLQEISIPAQISIPEFTILNTYTIPSLTIDFDEIKRKIIAKIDEIKEYELKTPDPMEIFGDLKVLYLSDLPDLTFPEITLSEIKLPAINIPTLQMEDFEITMLPIPEITLPRIPTDVCIPLFGRLQGQFSVNFPQYTLITTGTIENSTATPNNPKFTAVISSQAQSPIQLMEYTFEATAQLEAVGMEKLLFTENVKATHMAFSIDHEGSLTLTGNSVEASAMTAAKATTEVYSADLVNNIAITQKSPISVAIDTTYEHNLDIPSIETSSQASLRQDVAATIESGRITVTSESTANGKWSIQGYSDKGIHKSNAEFNVDFSTAKLSFEGQTESMALTSKQSLMAESVIFSHVTIEGSCETELPFAKKSVILLNGEARVEDLRVALTASHDAEFTGGLTGSMANSLEFMVHPFELLLDVKNKVNSKVSLPLKLTGKVDLQHDYGVILNSEQQRASWFALARFNQYKYNHNFTAENNDMEIVFHALANGEANLEFLTVPLSIPDLTIPYFEMRTPEVRDFSLWEDAGFKSLLVTPQQSFDMNLNLRYHKSPDMHTFELHLEPMYNAISDYGNIIQAQFEQCRDEVVALLKDSYNQAKAQYIKHKIDTSSRPPRIFTVPGYKIPMLNIEVSAFRAEMPAFTYFVPKEVSTPSFKLPALGFSVPSYTLVLPSLALPVIHVPETLSEIKLPTFTLPTIQNSITIPAIGNITCDFSFKSAVMTVIANAGLYNEPDIVARFSASSTSVFDILRGKIDGTTSLMRKRGIKVATTVTLEHNNVKAKHESAISLTKRSMEASVINTAKAEMPFIGLEVNQELSGNTKTQPSVVSKTNLRYMLDIPLISTRGGGNIDMQWELEALSSYVSLKTTTKSTSDLTIMDLFNYALLQNEANVYLNANGLRTTVSTSSYLTQNNEKEGRRKRSTDSNEINLKENLALEVSLHRLFATVSIRSNNSVNVASFSTNGKHSIKGELDIVPFATFITTLNIDSSQPSTLGHAELLHSISLSISSAKQSFTWSGKDRLESLIHSCDFLMSNDQSEIRMDMSSSVEGPLAFLKSVKLPVYQKALWDVLKFDQVTDLDNLQFLNLSSSIVYTKAVDGWEYTMPYQVSRDGVMFRIPGISMIVPSWVKEIGDSIRKIDMRYETPDVPDELTFPPVISVPATDVPFTNLQVDPFTIDPKNFNIPKLLTTKAFDIMLPGFPVMSVPSYDIQTEYLQGRTSYLAFKMPQYDIMVSSFTLPKSFTVGDLTIDLDEITSHTLNFELPTIIIPEQKIEIPAFALNLPLSVFIPAIGALSTTFKVSFPIYNVSATATMEKKDSSLVTSLSSICTSTVILLEYDLSANATLGFENGGITLNGKCNLIHNDVFVDWQHIMEQNLRDPHHTLNVDITSRTFSDANVRFASHKDVMTASVSSPSTGFLGLHLQRKSMTQFHGKLFSRYPSTPDKDTEVVTVKAQFRNSPRLTFQMSWNWDFLHDVIEGTKDRIPAITDSVLKFINKYHIAHFGFDLNRGGMKLKNTVSNGIERAYNEVPVSFTTLQNSLEQLSDQGRDMYRRASDSLMSMRIRDVTEQFLRYSEDKLYSLREISQRLSSLIEKISQYIREIDFTISGTGVAVNGNDIHEKLRSSLDQLKRLMQKLLNLLQKTGNDIVQVISAKCESFIMYLQDENMEIASKVDAIHAEMRQFSKRIEEAQRSIAMYKDHTKQKIQYTYNSFNREHVNNGTIELVDILQSHLYGGLNEYVDLMRRMSQKTAPYIQVSNKKLDINIPLPFH